MRVNDPNPSGSVNKVCDSLIFLGFLIVGFQHRKLFMSSDYICGGFARS